jgi:hypothetical protein
MQARFVSRSPHSVGSGLPPFGRRWAGPRESQPILLKKSHGVTRNAKLIAVGMTGPNCLPLPRLMGSSDHAAVRNSQISQPRIAQTYESPIPLARDKAIARACRAIDNIRLSRAATQHAITQSRKSLVETHALLVALRTSLNGQRFKLKDSPRQGRPLPYHHDRRS